ncbi:aldo/keto reductase [Yinghuangia seranimata]|uniref:aldo/keto reductase n=1 Tax=Yinghuangia seranimata TaxID=408067 RepID=UPI00248CB35D|nr:aldo/keto reductase [Yinghuangia seranimata]MDI2128280.1 aldo/keto reductase [Yinghuangia seranimata]
MRYSRVGGSGLKVSAVGLGCNNFGMRIDAAAADKVVGAALDAGVTFFDTAYIYGGGRSEEMLGRALGSRRDEVVVATKFGAPGKGPYDGGAARLQVMRQVETSLTRLGTDHIDLYYLHFPDPDTPMEETLAALDDLVRQGKVRYIANSNLTGWQLVDADHIARASGGARFIATQAEWSLLKRGIEREVVPAARHLDLGVIPYFPLASGLLTGKYRRGEEFPENTRFAAIPRLADGATDANFDIVEKLTAYAADHGRTLLELALSWLAAQPEVPSVLVGATSAEQAAANAAAVVDLTADELAEIAAITAGAVA